MTFYNTSQPCSSVNNTHWRQLIDAIIDLVIRDRVNSVISMTDDDSVMSCTIGEDSVELVRKGGRVFRRQVQEVEDIVLRPRVLVKPFKVAARTFDL